MTSLSLLTGGTGEAYMFKKNEKFLLSDFFIVIILNNDQIALKPPEQTYCECKLLV